MHQINMPVNCQPIIDKIYHKLKSRPIRGKVADYIPELRKVDPDKLGISVLTKDGKGYHAGNWDEPFSIQSIAKVLSLAFAYELLGERLWLRVDVEPSGGAFNSLIELEHDNGIPRNPFINAGALVIVDALISHFREPEEEMLMYVRNLSNLPDLQYSENIVRSEWSQGYRNIALANFLKSYKNIENDIDHVLDFYFKICSLSMSCHSVNHTFSFLMNGGVDLHSGKRILSNSRARRINAIMQTCGFYDEAGEFAYRVGLPGKSGVGGGIVAILPQKYCITVWSPALNDKGNSYKGMCFLEEFTSATETSIF